MDKIYSRKRINLPKSFNKNKNNEKLIKITKIVFIMCIAIVTANGIIYAIRPIVDKQCINMAKSISTKISNEQATIVMSKYKYEDLCTISKDNNGNITMIKANVIPINEIISDVAIKIQEELNKTDNSNFSIRLGSFTGSRLLSGKGPNVNIKMSTIGNLDTDLKSEFSSAGINQTLHKMYLQVDCNVIILTPFNTMEEKISNQVLLAEAVILGTTPNTYYNFDGVTTNNLLETIK